MTRRLILQRALQLGAIACLGSAAAFAHAADYPDMPIKLVVGFPPGGGGDLYGRAIAQALEPVLKQAVVVDNRAGAGGTIAAEQVAIAKPDGYTLILAMSGNMGSAPAIRKDLRYKVPDDFTFISELVETPYGLMVSGDSKIRTVAEYVEAAKSGKLTYASTGTGGAAQIVMEMVKQAGNLNILHVPYKGSGPVMTDLLGGRVDSFFAPYTPLMGQIKSGKLRLLAISSDKRVPEMADVPTLKESGLDVVMTQWYGLAAPKGTPAPVIEKLEAAVREAAKKPELLRTYRKDGAHEMVRQGNEFRDFVVNDIANYRRGAERGNLKVE
ncbi:MAG: tripartite tricarboxylate transporter substrate binding protein [Burkholderiaceae bacterium]|nr:tripartite tricarboxylate transporter substrate binding protein [Rhodoferax sp.]